MAARERTLQYHEVRAGDALPTLEVPLTATRIVAGAIASRDYQDVHHDAALARERGSRDIFMNILTTNGWVGRYVTDWAGPEALLRRVDIRLGAPNRRVEIEKDDFRHVQPHIATHFTGHQLGDQRLWHIPGPDKFHHVTLAIIRLVN